MSTIKKLEDLEIWKEALNLGKLIYRLTEKLPKSEEYNLKKHLKENARGFPANIAEGFSRYFRKEKLHFYGIARGCLGEMKSDIYFTFQAYPKILDKKLFEEYLEKIDRIGKKLNTFIKTTHISSPPSSTNQTNLTN